MGNALGERRGLKGEAALCGVSGRVGPGVVGTGRVGAPFLDGVVGVAGRGDNILPGEVGAEGG